ncbi:MAG: sulfate adenylyltransferase subunit 1 [Flavobacteriales bacterium]
MLRFATAGSVDDGKSTLIGRLLFDSKSLFEDQVEALRHSSLKKGLDFLDLSLVTDGLKAEREQGITIDVAYRYFSTPKRKFIVADTPGHVQYTRNMVTGASTADAMLVLIDARKGVLEQSRRHAFIASMLRVPHLLVCVNKMDLMDYDRKVFESIQREMNSFLNQLNFQSVQYIPISALDGDNVVDASQKMHWYEGASVLEMLEQLEGFESAMKSGARLPVQAVIRPRPNELDDHRHYAGLLTGDSLAIGDEIVVLPSGLQSKILRMSVGFDSCESAVPGQSVAIELADEIDVSRGDFIVAANAMPETLKEIDADICWLHSKPINAGARFLLRHTCVTLKCVLSGFDYRIDVNTGNQIQQSNERLAMNEIAGVRLRVAQPLYADSYKLNRTMGSFVLIDEFTNETVAAGMIR